MSSSSSLSSSMSFIIVLGTIQTTDEPRGKPPKFRHQPPFPHTLPLPRVYQRKQTLRVDTSFRSRRSPSRSCLLLVPARGRERRKGSVLRSRLASIARPTGDVHALWTILHFARTQPPTYVVYVILEHTANGPSFRSDGVASALVARVSP